MEERNVRVCKRTTNGRKKDRSIADGKRRQIMKTLRVIRITTFAAAVVGALFGAHSLAAAPQQTSRPQASAAGAEQVSPEEAQRRKDWNHSMLLKAAPGKGCFTSAYPSTEWKKVACGPKRTMPMLPRNGPRPNIVGNNNDISAEAPAGHISTAIGHFENISNVTSESGPVNNTGPSNANTYTLQINPNHFIVGGGTGVCAGSPNTGCGSWQQFVYENNGSGSAYIQYWLLAYGATCPTGQNWNQLSLYGSIYCWKNNSKGPAMVPAQAITNMANWTMSGQVSAAGDSVTMSTGTHAYTANGDNSVDAKDNWAITEFNIFGDGGGGQATFNNGASANTRTEIIYGGTSAPTCTAQGFTAETNSLSFGPTTPTATVPGPAVIFQESTAGGQTASCAQASTIGDTHVRTVESLLYDFQASGDFTIAEVAPNFTVQTRQVSGAPTWPKAAVNHAVAARFGKTKVAICMAPPGRDQTPSVYMNGMLTAVADGSLLALPEGAGISRQGNVYTLTSLGGDSVTATVNTPANATHWINVAVGLGTWPAALRGVIANANGNVNQIESRDQVVLTNPFGFDDLYHKFGDSWRVTGEDSMLTACNTDKEPVESGVPSGPFYANDLDAGAREKAGAACTTAGVAAGPLFDACTLDVAVIGDDSAAKAYVGAIPPAAVAAITGGRGAMPMKWWWLLLVLLAVIVIVWLLKRR
jgi:hypothetical protein